MCVGAGSVRVAPGCNAPLQDRRLTGTTGKTHTGHSKKGKGGIQPWMDKPKMPVLFLLFSGSVLYRTCVCSEVWLCLVCMCVSCAS